MWIPDYEKLFLLACWYFRLLFLLLAEYKHIKICFLLNLKKSYQKKLTPSSSSEFNCNLSFNKIFFLPESPEVVLLKYERNFHGI